MKQQTRRMAVAALVIAVLLVLVASFGVGSKPNPQAGRAEESTVNPLVGGLLVIVGGALSLAGSYWIETRRWEREDEIETRRWKREDEYRDYADRLRVYTEFTMSWSRYEEVKNTRLGDEAGRKALEEAYLQLLRSFNALSLLAPEEVRAAAVGVLRETLGVTDGGVTDDVRKEEDASGRFWKAVQKDRGKWPPRKLEEADDEDDR